MSSANSPVFDIQELQVPVMAVGRSILLKEREGKHCSH